MSLTYLHTMIRVKNLEKTISFFELLGLKEIRRVDSEGGRFTLIFLAAPGQESCPIELTYNWDGDDELPRIAVILATSHIVHLTFMHCAKN